MTEATFAATGTQAVARRRPIALATLCTVLFLTFLDTTIVSVALASIQTNLHAGVSGLQWVVGAYALTFASAMLIFGMIGDQFGRKKVMLIGVGVYCAGALVCALALNIAPTAALPVLLTGRAVMGLGAAASEPGTLSMLRHIYTEYHSRNRALGIWAAVSGLSLALGPVIGGALVGVWDWRAIFWFDVTFGVLAFVASAVFLPENSDPDPRRIDIAGGVFGAAALAALIFAVIQAENVRVLLACGDRAAVCERARRCRVRLVGGQGRPPAAGHQVPAGGQVHDPERGRVLRPTSRRSQSSSSPRCSWSRCRDSAVTGSPRSSCR